MAGKYAPLRDFLAELPQSKTTVTLSFRELEIILGTKLPKSASDYVEWWANQSYGPQAASWLGAGFVVDTVSATRKQVTFTRGVKLTRRKLRNTVPVNTNSAKKPIVAEELLNAGFSKAGDWQLVDGRISLKGNITSVPAVYAHVVDGDVVYVGSATKGLSRRMNSYLRPGPTQSTSIRVNQLIREQLSNNKTVWLIAASPEPAKWNNLPVDMVMGIEAGLIKKFSLPWNKLGA